MNNSNYFNVNYNCYENNLSPFGKKVLQILIQNCRQEHESNKNNHTQNIPVQKKRVLQFRDSNTYITRSPASHQINSRNEFNPNTQFNITITQNPLEESIKTTEFLKAVDVNNGNGTEIFAREDLVHSVSIHNANTELHDCYINNDRDIDLRLSLRKNNEVLKEINTVAWDDIIDTQLLVSDGNVVKQPKVLQSLEERQFLFDVSNLNGNNVNINNLSDCNDTDVGIKQQTIRKKNIKSIDKLPKKPKKSKETPNSLRKQKYTKVVKNWLNDVNSNNPIDEEAIAEKKAGISLGNANNDEMITEKTNNRVQSKTSKKVVQAQLANKDGIMKFSKPTKVNINSKNTLKNDKALKLDNVKDKKVKTKFEAPIKSQVPVKEVTYEIRTVNGIDFGKYQSELNGGGGEQEYVAVLVYSNNFNQLNRHYTDESCEVDGLMININNVFYYFKGVIEDSKEIFANILDGKLICYEGKHVINYLASKLNEEINVTSIIDAKICVSLLDPDDPPDTFSEVQKLLSFTPKYTIATECPLQKCAWYITLLKECVVIMTDMLIQHSLWNVFVNIEMRLLPVVAAMERRGVMVDLEKLKSMENILITKMKSVEQSCYKAAGRSFQINSPLQIRAILYEELQLDTKCNVKIRETLCQGAKSTSETMLRSLISEHPLPRLILEYRHLHKAHATFLTGIAHHVTHGVVKPTWVQTAAATGRIASNNPNLQAIPKAPFNLVMFPEDNNEDVPLLKFRSLYTSRPGYTLVAADFKHVECRVFAHVAADTSLLEALRSKQDLFKVLAAKWLQKPESEVSSEDRERTKRIIYASLYGAGTRKLMDILNISYDQTLAVVASFNRTFPSLKCFGRSVVSRCEQNGGRLSTICGRVRQIKNIASEDFGLRSQAERQAVNFIVQGSAADLCKMAMIQTNEQLGKCQQETHLLLQIHDELVWEVKDEHVLSVISIIKQVMENCGHYCGMSMDLPIEIHTGKNWGEMNKHTE